MKISDLDSSDNDGMVTASATVTWEDRDRPQQRLYMQVDANIVSEMSPSANAFLLAAIMPALHNRETRVEVEGEICPDLRNGLLTGMLQLRGFYGEKAAPGVRIEATRGFRPATPRQPNRTGMFLSGGVDSLATLRSNRHDFPEDHVGSIKDAIVVEGFDFGGAASEQYEHASFKRLLTALSTLADREGFTLIPVKTNLRQLGDEGVFFAVESLSAALAATAHQISDRISTVLVASSASVLDRGQIASHPLLDPGFASSSAIRICYDGARLERLDKVRLIADWSAAMEAIDVCNNPFPPEGTRNCGFCAKCLLTMTEILVCGKLEGSTAFPTQELSSEMLDQLLHVVPDNQHLTPQETLVASARVINDSDMWFWIELVDPLRSLGRVDLAASIEAKLKRCAEWRKKSPGDKLRGALKRIDADYLGGRLLDLKRSLRTRR